MNEHDTVVGRRLDEYQILRLLGRGGMARVYLGQDVRLKRYVAIKVIDRPYRSDEQYLQRFEREAQAVAQLEHPHIVRLYRYGETDGLLYMAMQYVEGADLSTILASYVRDGELMEAPDILRITRHVAQALDYAHSRDVIHRDVKPANVILDNIGAAYLADFGLALFAQAGTAGETFGTPEYMAPEQALSSSDVAPQSDIYAMGVLLYEMFTGGLPFTGGAPMEVAMRHVRQEPAAPRSLRPALSPEIEAVILKAMAKEPEQRYQSGAALVRDLEDALAAVPETSPITPARHSLPSVPERVSRVLAHEEPLPALEDGGPPPGQPASPETRPLTSGPSPAIAPRPAPRRARSPYARGCFVAGLLILLFLVFGATFLLGRAGDSAVLAPLLAGDDEAQATSPAPDDAPGAAATTTSAATPDVQPPTAQAEVQPSATPRPPRRRLRLVTNREESLFVVNVGERDVPLASLTVGNGPGAIFGDEWQWPSLAPGECVAVWNGNGQPQPPRVQCREVGERLEREGRELFWDRAYNVYEENGLVARCERREDCVIDLPPAR